MANKATEGSAGMGSGFPSPFCELNIQQLKKEPIKDPYLEPTAHKFRDEVLDDKKPLFMVLFLN